MPPGKPDTTKSEGNERAQKFTYDDALELLKTGELNLVARMPGASNSTFLVGIKNAEGEVAAAGIYKPAKGERPLWDFPDGLYRREIAAFELSDLMGWGFIPPTIERDGPHGIGSLQFFIDSDFSQHYFELIEHEEHHDVLRKICLFDLVANNTDRKAGHCLLSNWDEIYGIDQGLCFSEDFKLRTVIWDFSGEQLTDAMLEDLQKISTEPLKRLEHWLSSPEIEATRERARQLADLERFPVDESGRRWPWPLV